MHKDPDRTLPHPGPTETQRLTPVEPMSQDDRTNPHIEQSGPKVDETYEYGGMKFLVSSVDEPTGDVYGFDVTHGFNARDQKLVFSKDDFKQFKRIEPDVAP